MNAKRMLTAMWAPMAASFSSAYAAAGPREDTSGIFVWIFLGFCALIVVLQLVPAILMLFGIAKGLKPENKEMAEAESEVSETH